MEFPAFTVCPQYSNAFKCDVLTKDKLTPSDLREFNYPKYVDSAKYLEEVCYNLSEVVKDISVIVQENPSGSHSTFSTSLFSSTKMMNYSDQFYHLYGRCSTFQIPLWIQKLQVIKVVPKTNIANTYKLIK